MASVVPHSTPIKARHSKAKPISVPAPEPTFDPEELLVSVAEFRENIAEILNKVAFGKERVVLHRRGKEVACVLPIEALRFIQRFEDERDVREAEEALAEMREKGGIPWEDLKKELGL